MNEVIGIPSIVFWPLTVFATVVAAALLAVCFGPIVRNWKRPPVVDSETGPDEGRFAATIDAIRRSQV